MKIKTAELEGAALDWAVGCILYGPEQLYFEHDGKLCFQSRRWNPSTNWSQGGPIIEREGISLEPLKEGDGWCACFGCTVHDFLLWDQPYNADAAYGEGFTPLVAVMRCFVASRLGDEVDVPNYQFDSN